MENLELSLSLWSAGVRVVLYVVKLSPAKQSVSLPSRPPPPPPPPPRGPTTESPPKVFSFSVPHVQNDPELKWTLTAPERREGELEMLHRPAPISYHIDSYIIPKECAHNTCVERNHNTPCVNVYNVAALAVALVVVVVLVVVAARRAHSVPGEALG